MFQECGHGGLEVVMSSFLSWEEAAKVSRPSPPSVRAGSCTRFLESGAGMVRGQSMQTDVEMKR